MENSQHTDTNSLGAWSEAGRRMALLMVLEQIHFPPQCVVRYRSHSKDFWVLPKCICILQKYWWVCKVWSTVCHLMQHHLLQNILLPEKILNFFKISLVLLSPAQWRYKTVPKGFSLLMGCLWENVAELECGAWRPFILPGVFLRALIRFDRLQCSVSALFKKELIAGNKGCG